MQERASTTTTRLGRYLLELPDAVSWLGERFPDFLRKDGVFFWVGLAGEWERGMGMGMGGMLGDGGSSVGDGSVLLRLVRLRESYGNWTGNFIRLTGPTIFCYLQISTISISCVGNIEGLV
jgi:hypothetical protein